MIKLGDANSLAKINKKKFSESTCKIIAIFD